VGFAFLLFFEKLPIFDDSFLKMIKLSLKKIYHNINDFKTYNDLCIERKYQRINSHEQKTTVENH